MKTSDGHTMSSSSFAVCAAQDDKQRTSSIHRRLSQSPPRAAVARQKFVGLFWSPRSGGVFEQSRLILLRDPGLFERVDKGPRFFDFVAPREESGVAAHRIEQQALIRFGTRLAERGSVMKIHLHGLDPKTGAGHFRLHAQRNSFIWLNADHEDILIERDGFLVEQNGRCLLEMDGNLRA